MTGIMNVVHGVGHFFTNIWLGLSPNIRAAAAAAGQDALDVGKGALAAAVTGAIAAKAQGGDLDAMKDAAIKGGVGHLETVGVTVALHDIAPLGTIAAHIADGTDHVPAPPT